MLSGPQRPAALRPDDLSTRSFARRLWDQKLCNWLPCFLAGHRQLPGSPSLDTGDLESLRKCTNDYRGGRWRHRVAYLPPDPRVHRTRHIPATPDAAMLENEVVREAL